MNNKKSVNLLTVIPETSRYRKVFLTQEIKQIELSANKNSTCFKHLKC